MNILVLLTVVTIAALTVAVLAGAGLLYWRQQALDARRLDLAIDLDVAATVLALIAMQQADRLPDRLPYIFTERYPTLVDLVLTHASTWLTTGAISANRGTIAAIADLEAARVARVTALLDAHTPT